MIAAIIVAAGQGLRMGTALRKQYLDLAGRPVLVHTLQAFDRCHEVSALILVAPQEELDYCRQAIVGRADLRASIELVQGGPRRQDSVFNGLSTIQATEGIVLIHDGVRPLVTPGLIRNCIAGARNNKACVPAIPVVDTLKRVNATNVILQTLARDSILMAQTPQAFDLALIRSAHATARAQEWQATDDASLVERLGVPVHVIPGLRTNIKITTPQDLTWAEFYLKIQAETQPQLNGKN